MILTARCYLFSNFFPLQFLRGKYFLEETTRILRILLGLDHVGCKMLIGCEDIEFCWRETFGILLFSFGIWRFFGFIFEFGRDWFELCGNGLFMKFLGKLLNFFHLFLRVGLQTHQFFGHFFVLVILLYELRLEIGDLFGVVGFHFVVIFLKIFHLIKQLRQVVSCVLIIIFVIVL